MKRFLGALAALLAFPTLALAQVPHTFAGLRGNVPASYLDDNFAYLYTNKLSVTLSSGQMLVGNGSNVATARTPSGDCGVSNTGVFSCTPFLRVANNLSDLASAVTARTNLGVAIGTNVEAWDADLDALAALSGTNTIYYRSGANAWSPVTIGTNLVFSAGTLTASGGVSTALTSAHTLIGNASNVATDTAISGDATLANTGALTLATVNGSPGSYGAAWSIPTFTADAKGRLTAAGATTPTIPSATVTGAMLASGAASTNLSLGTGVATLLTGSASGTGGPAGTSAPTFTNPALTNTTVMGNYANWLAAQGLANFVTPEQASPAAKGDGTTDDTAAWQNVTSVAGRSIYCRPGATYLIASTVTITVNNVHLYGKCVFKAKMGAGGFNSVELNTNRYTSEPVIYWSAVDGGGFEYIEVYPSAYPGAGGDYALIPVAVRSGMATQPFVAGTLYVHDTTGLPSGDLAIDSIGAAGLTIDHVNCTNFGTDYTGWTYNGMTPPYGAISNLCLHIDTDEVSAVTSSRLHLGDLSGTNGYLGADTYAIAGEQTSFMVLGGSGGVIGSVDYTGQGQGIDIQSSNWLIGRVTCANVMICYKMGYGASYNRIGPSYISNTLLEGLLFYGDSNAALTTANNSVGPVSGQGISERTQLTGALASATSTTAVLPVGAVTVDNYYRAGYVMHMTSGAHSASECTITGYVGATKTVTCSGGWTSGTPAGGDSFTILGTDASHRTAAFWGQETMGFVANNQAALDKIVNGGLRTYDAYSNIVSGSSTGNTYSLSGSCAGVAAAAIGGTGTGVTGGTPVCTPLATVATSGSASDLTTGTLAAARGGAGTITGALKGSGAGVVTQAACADLSNGAASCSTDTTNATNITSGTLGAARLPNPSASTLGGVESLASTTHKWINTISTSGVPAATQPACADVSDAGTSCTVSTGTSGATIPLLNGANTWSGVQSINSGDLALKGATSGTVTLNAAATAGSSTLTLPAGTTDFSATGGTSQVVKQTSTGGAFTVARLACADLSNTGTSCTVNTGTSGATIPLLNAANTFSADQTFSTHILATGTSPTISACGTSPSVTGGLTANNQRGYITTGTGTVTACTLTFASAFPGAVTPACTVSLVATSSPAIFVSSASATALTVGFASTYASGVFSYVCMG